MCVCVGGVVRASCFGLFASVHPGRGTAGVMSQWDWQDIQFTQG